MRSVVAMFALAATAGCAEKAVELRLLMPTNDDAAMDVSCVTTVHVVLHNGSSDFSTVPQQCIDVSSPTSFADLEAQIRGKFEMDIPDNLLAVEVRGLTGTSAAVCGDGMDVFYAGDEFVGQDRIDLRIKGAMDCSAMRSTGELKVRPVDFLALAKTPVGMAPACDPIEDEFLEIGAIRPTNISLPEVGFPTSLMEFGPGAELDSTTGVATLPAWGAALPTSCLAVSAFDMFSASCVYPGNATVCGQPGEVEVPLIDDLASYESIDGAIYKDFPVLVFGVVYDTVTKRPVEGAKVEMDPARARVVYANPGAGNRLDPITADATNASGLFLAYMREPSVATVTQGASTKKMRLGGVTSWGSAVIVPLR